MALELHNTTVITMPMGDGKFEFDFVEGDDPNDIEAATLALRAKSPLSDAAIARELARQGA